MLFSNKLHYEITTLSHPFFYTIVYNNIIKKHANCQLHSIIQY
jgi:hypothetical protein